MISVEVREDVAGGLLQREKVEVPCVSPAFNEPEEEQI